MSGTPAPLPCKRSLPGLEEFGDSPGAEEAWEMCSRCHTWFSGTQKTWKTKTPTRPTSQ